MFLESSRIFKILLQCTTVAAQNPSLFKNSPASCSQLSERLIGLKMTAFFFNMIIYTQFLLDLSFLSQPRLTFVSMGLDCYID